MRLNYRWDLTGFEEEEVSGSGASPPQPRALPHTLPGPPPHSFLGTRVEALVVKPRPSCSPPASQFLSLGLESPAVARVTV